MLLYTKEFPTMKKLTTIASVCLLLFNITQAAPLEPNQLTCEYITNPLGIDVAKPRFSWTFITTTRNQFQSAYELLVSDNLAAIQQGKGNIWTTGKITTAQNLHIEYNGTPLKSFTKYYWRVRVYNQDGEASAWSQPATFETAMLQPEDWKAQWIGDGSQLPEKDEDFYAADRMPLFRKTFMADKKIQSARLYISGMGYYEAYLNGKKISDHVLDPGFTTYAKQVFYVVHDITSFIKKGNNIAGIMLGNGWWNPLPFKFFGRWKLSDYQQTGRPCVKAAIHLTYNDGTTSTIISDASWQTAPGPIVRNNIYLGEHYDARLEQKEWLTQSAVNWKNAVIVSGPSGTLTAQMQPAIKITKVVQPVSITEHGKDTFIVNMGQNFAGVARIKVKGPAGTKITIRYGESLFDDGSLNVMTAVATQIKKGGIKGGPGAPETAWQEDSYILKGGGTETWAPKFTFHGFQYLEITGWPGKPTVQDIEGLRMNTDLPSNGQFACSNAALNRLHDVIQWTFLSNVFSVQSDCPGREKMGYGADIVVAANAYMFNYNMAGFYNKTVRDFANEQRPKGGITEIAPFTGIDDKGFGDLSGPLGWQLAFPYLQQQLYDWYGDKRVIEAYYPALQRQIAFLQPHAKNHLFYWDISDHEAIDPKPESLSASAFYYHHVQLAATFAGLLGKREDSLQYDRLRKQIKNSITRQYLVPGTGRFDNATQSAQLFALWYDLSPEKERSFDVLMKELERHQWHVSTGIFATKMFFDVMRIYDKNEVAYRVANQPDFPGWLHMLNKGATTLWESWNHPGTLYSCNHPMFGSIDEWMYRSLLGINAASPGFSTIIIKPQPAGDCTWAKGQYQSIRGVIGSDWKKENGLFVLKVTIPGNTKAEVWIPAKENGALQEGGKPVQVIRYEKGYAVVAVGSGTYEFTSTI
jgi:alpha-L-rhamnosidase